MPAQPSVISYETPTPPRGVQPIVWWFVADGLLFFAGFMVAAVYYHGSYNPNDPGAASRGGADHQSPSDVVASAVPLARYLGRGFEVAAARPCRITNRCNGPARRNGRW